MTEKLRVVMELLMDDAVRIWERDGVLQSTSWAMGESMAGFATSYDMEGAHISDYNRIGLHAMLAACVEARYIGRIDESWARMQDASIPVPVSGELGALADTDPTIGTAICVQAYDLVEANAYVALARMTLDDEGAIAWNRATFEEPEGRLIGASLMTADIIPRVLSHGRPGVEELQHLMESLHWTMVVGDGLGAW